MIVFPFLILLFWLLGGGEGKASLAAVPSKGLNLQLPDAKVEPVSALDKLSFYAMAKQDSLKRVEQEQLDPLYAKEITEEAIEDFEEKKISRIYQVPNRSMPIYDDYASRAKENLQPLEQMVQALQQPKQDDDIVQLNQTLQQLVALQQAGDNISQARSVKEFFSVQTEKSISGTGFYGLSETMEDTSAVDLILAVVHGAQQVQEGSVIKLRLLQDVFIQQEKIPAGSFLFGLASMDQERLQIVIRSIPWSGKLFSVSLTVLGVDGIEGIYMPGSIEREVMKQSAEQAVHSFGGMGAGQSLSSQIATAGIGTAKNIFSRKARQVRVTIKSGYRVLLRDEKRREL